MTRNYPRLNEFPEWFPVERDHTYVVRVNRGRPRRYTGTDPIAGIPFAIDAGSEIVMEISEGGSPPHAVP